jgi:hypothetical protein
LSLLTYLLDEDIKTQEWLREISAAAIMADRYEPNLTQAKRHYYDAMAELEPEQCGCNAQDATEVAAVGAGIGGGFENMAELKLIKYDEAMNGPDKEKWYIAFDEEHERMEKYGVWQAVRRCDLAGAAKILTTTSAMKMKASGRFRAHLNARGFEQRIGVHYDAQSISTPVSSENVIHIMLVLMIMAGWVGAIIDVQGAFLHGKFDYGETIHMEVPQGFEKHYDHMYYVLL